MDFGKYVLQLRLFSQYETCCSVLESGWGVPAHPLRTHTCIHSLSTCTFPVGIPTGFNLYKTLPIFVHENVCRPNRASKRYMPSLEGMTFGCLLCYGGRNGPRSSSFWKTTKKHDAAPHSRLMDATHDVSPRECGCRTQSTVCLCPPLVPWHWEATQTDQS